VAAHRKADILRYRPPYERRADRNVDQTEAEVRLMIRALFIQNESKEEVT